MTLTYTKNLHLAVPDFLTEPWHGEFAAAMDSIDQILFNAVILQQSGLWVNNHVYAIGDVVISPDTGLLYSAAQGHTSSPTGTFTAELALHPTFWTSFATIVLASQGEAEAGVENTKYMSPLRTKQAIAALSSGGGGSAISGPPRAGILTRVSTTALKFAPFGGNQVKINGVLYTIPNGGIAGLGNTGVYVNGVAAQNLVANTYYLVFVQVIGGVLTGDFHTGVSHRPSQGAGNQGTEVLFSVSDFDNFSLIGQVRTDGAAHFLDSANQRFTRSWFNDPGITLTNHFTTSRANVSAAYSEVNSEIRVEWLNWANEPISLDFSAPVFDDGVNDTTIETSIGIDSTTVAQDCWGYINTYGDSHAQNMVVHLDTRPSEGYHFATVLGRTTFTANYFVTANTAGNRPTLQGCIAKGW